MKNPPRVSPTEVRQKLLAGAPLLFVCAYPLGAYRRMNLEGSISLEEFESRVESLPRTQAIVFY